MTAGVSRRGALLGGALIVLAGFAAYRNSLGCPFTYDDAGSILENPSIRHLWPPGPVLHPPYAGGETVGGRPVLNLSLALNYAISGPRVWSYHALNALIHALAGLALFGVIRRTRQAGAGLALAVALLWTVHPLQTEAVTYTVQRAESLMGLFYLLTLYCFIRARRRSLDASYAAAISGQEGRKSGVWLILSVIACLLGMATKEVMVSAPVVVLLYDRTFVAGTFRRAWSERRVYYLALGATWALLFALIAGTHGRGGSIGYGNVSGVHWWSYALTQFPAIARYLRLSFWPSPLVFDYGVYWVRSPAEVLFPAALVLGGAALTFWALARGEPRPRWRAAGFLGFWFFAILAPTSSVVPGTTQMIVEHRMYLPLAAVLALAAALARGLARRLFPARAGAAGALLCAALAVAGAALTARRNAVYGDSLALWRDTAARRPDAPRPLSYLGAVLVERGRTAEAMEVFERVLRIDPDYPQARNGEGTIYLGSGRTAEAIDQYERAVAAAPGYAEAHYNLGLALAAAGRPAEAVPHEEAALAIRPDYPEALNTLAGALFRLGRLPDALACYRRAAALDPDNAEVRHNLGVALAQSGRLAESAAELRAAARLRPDNPTIRRSLEQVEAALARPAGR